MNVTVLSDVVKNVVVHCEGRQYPGIVVQGDRLHNWLALARSGTENDRAILTVWLEGAVAVLDRVSNGLPQPGPHAHPSED
ncbi:MAG: hypothetical protein QOJ11_565 [Frankiales bacterium]|nr:hypothetical protein [Frankiales bacterium]